MAGRLIVLVHVWTKYEEYDEFQVFPQRRKQGRSISLLPTP